MKHLIVLFINIYQRTLSPDHGWFRTHYPYGFCRFYPSCSEYTRISILRLGILRGLYLGATRILRCNPFTLPKIDMPNKE